MRNIAFLFLLSGAGALVFLVFDVVLNRTASIVAGSVAGVFFALLWAVFPLLRRNVDS